MRGHYGPRSTAKVSSLSGVGRLNWRSGVTGAMS
jgi:hypothetical protein